MVTGVVLAAGASTRMGVNKLLLPLGAEPLVCRTVRELRSAGCDEMLVVLGRDAERVRHALAPFACRFVVNHDYRHGMGSSFRAAVDVLESCDAALFALADQPFVSARSFQRLLDAYSQRDAPLAIVCARFGAVTAPPHLFARELFGELAQLVHGARPVLARHADRSLVIELPADELMDIDTPDDYERAKARAAAP